MSVPSPGCSHTPDGGGHSARLCDGRVTMYDPVEEERRIAEWRRVTRNIPMRMHKYSSPTWTDHTFYRGKKKEKGENSVAVLTEEDKINCTS